jgi:hypothetical protein
VGQSLDDSNLDAYGTCAASIALSNIGIMIQGTLVSMKATEDNGDLKIANLWTAIYRAIADITEKRRQGRSVINIHGKSIIYQMAFIHNNLHKII